MIREWDCVICGRLTDQRLFGHWCCERWKCVKAQTWWWLKKAWRT